MHQEVCKLQHWDKNYVIPKIFFIWCNLVYHMRKDFYWTQLFKLYKWGKTPLALCNALGGTVHHWFLKKNVFILCIRISLHSYENLGNYSVYSFQIIIFFLFNTSLNFLNIISILIVLCKIYILRIIKTKLN